MGGGGGGGQPHDSAVSENPAATDEKSGLLKKANILHFQK